MKAHAPCSAFRSIAIAAGLTLVPSILSGQEEAGPATAGAPLTITEAAQIWNVPVGQKRMKLPLHIEARVNYADRMWRLLWLENNHVSSFLPMAGNSPELPNGARVLIEGSIIPEQGLSAALAKVTVLQAHEPIDPIVANGRINELTTEEGGRIVAVDAYVDDQQFIDDDHLRLMLIVDERLVVGWVKPANPRSLPDFAGKFVHLEGVYSARFDPTHTDRGIELWIGEERNVKVTESLETFHAFEMEPICIDRLYDLPANTPVLVRGRAQAHVPGSHLIVRDATGQVLVRTLQQSRVPIGTKVEAIGRVGTEGSRWVLRAGYFRRQVEMGRTEETVSADAPLETVDQIRQLSLADAARGRRVTIFGVVTWSMADENFFFLQDVTGGIRVRFDRAKFSAPALTKSLRIEGVTYSGAFAPSVDLVKAIDMGSMNAPEPRRVMYEQAVTGKEDGEWVEMRGFLQHIDSEGDLRYIHVTAPAGDFVARLLSPVNLEANPGSLIRVRGVCEATADTAGRITGVLLRVPFLHSINVEEDAPADFFDVPRRSIKDLRRMEGTRDLARVRVDGTVLNQVPGRTVYVEDDGVGLQLLTREKTPLNPGDRVEAVGILGREGARVVLRETAYRKVRDGAAPVPILIQDPARPVPELDARLARVHGLLIDISPQNAFTRFTLQSGTTLFEALLEGDQIELLPQVGSELTLTGIYQLAYDDSRQSRGFALRLRSPADVLVTRAPRIWNLHRALLALGILGACAVLGLAWIAALRRRVAKQTDQIRAQLERQARIEAGAERAARLESLGVLAGGIAHDFNNLLTIIVGNLSLAKLEERRSPELQRCLEEIGRVTVRARLLTQQLLTFAKGGEPLRGALVVEPIVREAAQRTIAGAQVGLTFATAPALWAANADRDQLAQIVQALVSNAVQAMPLGGTVRIGLANEALAAGAKDGLAAGRYVRLSISDNGEGIPRDILPKIFDPYFSTRKGSAGLGLSTVYSIVKRHQGWVDVQSSLGAGTHVDIWLPAAEPKVAEIPVKSEVPMATNPARTPTKAARILILEDEESIRRIAAAILKRSGHEVVAVAEGAEAVKEFSVALHSQHPFELVILDLTIPGGLGGKEVIEMIRKLDQNVPAIVSSGYSSDAVMANFARYGFQSAVPKPYEVEQLLAEVERLLQTP